jgi:hypothetical protein
MTTGMFILREDGSLAPMSSQPYDSESLLQSWIADHPELLAGDQINHDNPRRWLLVKREAGVPGEESLWVRWSLDHLFIDQDGIPTFVEVKRSSDTRIRREVVGQMLDYAANGLRYWTVESIQGMFLERCLTESKTADIELAKCLGESVVPEEFWGMVRSNLEDGTVRLLFVSDEIPTELLAVVEFLNRQMTRTEVLAIEVSQYVEVGDGPMVTLVPRVLGQTVESQQKKQTGHSGRRHWDEASFFAEASHKLPSAEVDVLRKIYDWSLQNLPRMTFGHGKYIGSFSAALDLPEGAVWPIYVYSDGSIEFQFQYMVNQPVFGDLGLRMQFLEKLSVIDQFRHPINEPTLLRRPSIRAGGLVNKGELRKLFDALNWFVATARAKH